MDISDVKETRIIKCDSDPVSPKQSTKTLNRWLEAGWILVHCYTRDAGDANGPDGFPCFVIGWPHPFPPILPKELPS
jgi:hypothetical protein